MRRILLLSVVALALVGGVALTQGGGLKIGLLYNLTGGLSSLDVPAQRGALLACEQVNARGGVLGAPVECLTSDTQTDLVVVAQTAARFIEVDKVNVLTGYTDSDSGNAAGPVAQAAGIPFVTAGATDPFLPDRVGNYFFLAPFGDNTQAFVEANFAYRELGARRAYALVDEQSIFTVNLDMFFEERWQALGGEIVRRDSYSTGDTDFSSYIANIRALNPPADLIFISALPVEAGLTVRQIRAAGINTPIISGDGFDTELVDQTGASEVYFSTHVSFENPRAEVQQFVADYQARYGVAPENAFAALGYDAVNLILDAVTRAGSTDPAAIRDALAATTGLAAVTGIIGYVPPSQVPAKSVTIIQITEGRRSFRFEGQP
ncbi:MAG: ABC transporter substrate-binding protein [Deinococcus sp.]|nr:ABC transporter substrate-binding protein [Deinococcus sp.]